MTRTLVVVLFGALLGAAATLFVVRRPTGPEPLALRPDVPVPALATASSGTATDAATGRAFYRRLADAGPAELARMIEQAAAEPPSAERAVALATLLQRYAEIDAARAAQLARAADADGTALAAVYAAWVRADEPATLAALRNLARPDDAAAVALALIAALGNDAAAFERITAVLATREPGPSTAVRPPAAPFMSVFAPRSALALTAERWAELDPERALASSARIGDEQLRLALEAAALRAVARVAPDATLAHLANRSTDLQQFGVLGGAVFELARTHPERLLAATSRWPPDLRRMVESTTLQQLAERDPPSAARYLESVPAGPDRQALAQVVARAYGRRDVAAALAWARAQSGQQNLVASALAGAAEQNATLALDLALELSSPMERTRAVQMIAMAGAQSDPEAEAIADRLLAVGDAPLRDSHVSMLLSMWSSRSPENAMRWLLAHGQQASPQLYQSVGQNMANRDARSAIAYSMQIPAAAREAWIHGVAQGYAQSDPSGAIEWFSQFRAESWYGRGAATLAMALAHRDGAAAARLVDEVDVTGAGPQAQQLIDVIATNWANQDPAAAAAWIVDRGPTHERAAALHNVVGVWSVQDFDAARQWTLRQPPSTVRDGALVRLLTTSATMRGPASLDAGLLDAFSSPAARQQAVLQIVQSLAYGDLPRAQAVADTHLADPALRAQAQRYFDAARDGTQRPQVSIGVSDRSIQSAPLLRTR